MFGLRGVVGWYEIGLWSISDKMVSCETDNIDKMVDDEMVSCETDSWSWDGWLFSISSLISLSSHLVLGLIYKYNHMSKS